MEFDVYLKEKKIDPELFLKNETEEFHEWKRIFDQVHPNSFTQQKLFLINKIRRTYPLKEATTDVNSAAPKMMRPKIKPLKPKTS